MAKKRVHEIAKELGFQNKDLIVKLQELGFEVKSHSSSVDEADVREALRKAEEQRRSSTDEKKLKAGVIRRRPKGKSGNTIIRRRGAVSVPDEAEAIEPATSESQRERQVSPEQGSSAVASVESAQPEEQPIEASTEASVEASEQTVESGAAPQNESAGDEKIAASDDSEEQSVAVSADSTAEEASEASPAPTIRGQRKEEEKKPVARVARPDTRRREEEIDEEDQKPEMDLEALGLSESDFTRSDDKEEARVAPPSPSRMPVTMKREEEKATKVVRRIDPAVLQARLAAAKRPEPPKEWGKTEVPASPVTELVVRTDASGKRRELVDVRKEAARNKSGRAGQTRREEMSAKDLLEHRRGQVYYPTPNRRRVKTRAKTKARVEAVSTVAKRPIEIGESITVAELARQMSLKATDIIRFHMKQGVMATMNQPIEHDIAAMVAIEFEYEVVSKVFNVEEKLEGVSLDEAKAKEDPDAVLRAPVVTVMGHVDHGKTSLLDRIRHARVADGEAGGITQAIAGYQVNTSKGLITFLDTPGHKAFTAMRARGANITEIVILVVAADDGVMPQTLEAIEHAKGADVPIIVAINKMDKPEANPDRVLQQLSSHGLLVEEWGGDILSRKISAKTGDGLDELLEQIALQSEIMELKANPTLSATGHVVEGEVHKGRGSVATVLVQEGTLKVGDAVIAGEAIGKVRALLNDKGERVKSAGPSVPVQILGLNAVPAPGDEFRVAKSLDAARKIAAHREELRRESENSRQSKVSLEDLFSKLNAGEQKELKIIIKADVQGSVEALRNSLESLSTKKVGVRVISGGVGAIVESDIEFASASEALVVGFGVRPDTKAIKAARALGGIEIKTYSVIYECVDEVKLAMQGMLSPVTREKYLGRAEIRQTFSVPKVGTVAGCAIVDGIVSRSSQIRVLRDSKEIYTGKLSSLKRFKDDVKEVKEGFECGMGVEKFNDLKEGDIIESFEMEEVAAVLDEPVASGEEVRL
ncbi:MAG: translation initiation factor IF-2 [Myxococcota bacterium]|nr:translation initiation factor IF-2 [Myxococcota bacterium]